MIFFNGQRIMRSGDQIGGRNYLLHTSDFSKGWGLSKEHGGVTNDTYLGGKIVLLKNNGQSFNNFSQDLPNELSNKDVIWSCFAKADIAGDMLHTEPWGSNGCNQALTTEWQRYSFAGRLSDNKNGHKTTLFFWGIDTNKGNVYIALPKLEIGSVATDWTPAPEDFLTN